jgi:hypothetical protein
MLDSMKEDGQPGVAARIGEGERVVGDVGVAVPRLRIARIGHGRVGAEHAPEERVPRVRLRRPEGRLQPAVQVHKARDRKFLPRGEAARGVQRQSICIFPNLPLSV